MLTVRYENNTYFRATVIINSKNHITTNEHPKSVNFLATDIVFPTKATDFLSPQRTKYIVDVHKTKVLSREVRANM